MSNKRYEGAVALIISQTNYDEATAKKKLEEWEGNYMNVIKEYLNPKFQEKQKSVKKSTNEMMMAEIRYFMDNASKQYEQRKVIKTKKEEYLKLVYTKFLEVKKNYPDCLFNPPKELSCTEECKNPMCPGKLKEDKTYSKLASKNETLASEKTDKDST